MNWTVISIIVGYLGFVFVSLFCVLKYERRKSCRHPLPEDFKLLRMPGEHLHRRVIDSDEADVHEFLIGAMLPPLVFFGGVSLVLNYFREFTISGLVLVLVVSIITFIGFIRRIQRSWKRRRNDYLGFFGERFVAECLEPLKADGWHVLHDLPCEANGKKFNLDHVVVGAGGVWVIETKTRRKGASGPGQKSHEVIFDGEQIQWPMARESKSIQQAQSGARWLAAWIKTNTGIETPVRAIVTIPGWMVREQKLGPVRVTNPKGLVSVISASSDRAQLLNSSQVDLLRRQLELKCRDVEY